MAADTTAFVHRAEVELVHGDEAAPGAAITTELCGSSRHAGACRWPHNTAVSRDADTAVLRIVFVAPADETAKIRARIRRALEGGRVSTAVGPRQWRLLSDEPGVILEHEEPLARRLQGTAD